MTPTLLLTGATGFVGRQVLRACMARRARIRLILRHGVEPPAVDAELVESIVRTHDLFVESEEWWAHACDGVDAVVHVAWYTEPGKYIQSPKNIECLIGTMQLARGAAAAGVRRVVGVGTCAEYDLSTQPLTIAAALRPTSPYAAAKAASFLALSQFLPERGVEFAWCRLFYLFGEGEDERRLVPYLRRSLLAGEVAELTSGEQVRDFIDVQEAGKMIAEVALGSVQGPVNICTGIPVTVREMAERVADEVGRRDLLRFGVRPDNQFDPPTVVGVRGTDLA